MPGALGTVETAGNLERFLMVREIWASVIFPVYDVGATEMVANVSLGILTRDVV